MRILDLAFSIGLVAPALVFVYYYVTEFLERKTFFVEKSVPLTQNDLPVITMCFSYSSDKFSNLTEKQRIEIRNGEYLRKLLSPMAQRPITIFPNSEDGREWILKNSWVFSQFTYRGTKLFQYNGEIRPLFDKIP